ncbi:PHB depolymerase family esterase [Boeremia exigua]|uniref:PHB depolymerase family esterase n=1 Tax=Boeremia exigua TaxID=749465 RepID=UPI001E8E61C4|nr:PHB depolymerase family esterase [Boeremia exigua]KAH6638504.1 PHB depolymerase family esterase [Boeremia exigua]
MFVLNTLLVSIFLARVNGALTQVSNFGTNPAGIQMFVDVPANVVSKAPIIVALHGCHGSAQSYYRDNALPTLAKQKNVILIYPSSTHDLLCWDAGTKKSLTRDGGGDPQSIVQMVKYVVNTYSADATKVYIVGTSSGAMMGNVLAAVYPDVFAAASVYSGVAAGCTAVPDGTPPNPYDPCALGRVTKTPNQWGDIVRSYNPGYSGPWPRMQIWHGTSDNIVVYQNFIEDLKQWSNIHGASFGSNTTNNPETAYTRINYGDGTKLVGYSAKGVGHVVPVHPAQAISFFKL